VADFFIDERPSQIGSLTTVENLKTDSLTKMIIHKQQYYKWIQQQGVGLRDKIASSPDSYLSYLNSVSELLREDISPALLSREQDVLAIAQKLQGRKAPGTIRNYKSAMRQYVAMIHAHSLSARPAPLITISESPNKRAVIKTISTEARSLSATEHNLYSSYREILLEHLFSGEVMKHLWLRGNIRIETLKPQVDDAGYDLVLEANSVVRHVQLKSSHVGSSTSDVRVSLHLAKKPSGCVVWLWFDPTSLQLGPFLFFGSEPGCPLPDISHFKIAKHAKGNSQGVKLERPNVRVIPKSRFECLISVDDLVLKLFGPMKIAESE